MMRVLVLLLGLLPGIAAAQDAPVGQAQPQIQVTLDPQGPVTVGNPLTVTLTLLVPTYMPQPPVWPDMQLADAITRQVSVGSRPVTSRIGGQSWAGISHVYQITPQRGADYLLPSGKVTVTYADPATNTPLTIDVPVPEIDFSAVIPKGAEALDPFVSTQSLTLSAKVDGIDTGGEKPLSLGASVTQTVTIEAQGTQAMLLPSLLADLPVPDGLHAYPKEPEITDTPGQRGDSDTARRVEAVTYIIEKPGSYDLPALKLDWWNAASARIDHASAEVVHFQVPAPPGWGDRKKDFGTMWPWLILILAILAIFALAFRPVTAWLGLRRARYLDSELARYRNLVDDVFHGPVGQLRPRLWLWLKALGSAEIPAATEKCLIAMEQSVYGPHAGETSDPKKLRRDLARTIQDHRRAVKAKAGRTRETGLPALNPWHEQ